MYAYYEMLQLLQYFTNITISNSFFFVSIYVHVSYIYALIYALKCSEFMYITE